MRLVLLATLVACARPDVIEPSATTPIPVHEERTLDATHKERRRMVQPEVFLRAYLMWFGGLAAKDVPRRARPGDLFDQWNDYLGALGLPDYHLDIPRAAQSNSVMLAAIGRLGEALCVRAVEHDLRDRPPIDTRVIFAFDEPAEPLTLEAFTPRFDVLHRTFLGYPAELAPAGRTAQFFALYQQVAKHHAGATLLTPSRTAWAAICTALIQHPETELY